MLSEQGLTCSHQNRYEPPVLMVGCQSSGTTWLAWLLHHASGGSFTSELGLIRSCLIWFKHTISTPDEFRAARFGEFADMFRALRGGDIGARNKWNDAYPVVCRVLNEMNEQGLLDAFADTGNVDGFIRHLTYTVHNEGAKSGNFWGDKYPEYLLSLPQLHSIYPGARWIFVIRDPLSTSHSLLTTRRGQSGARPVVQELRRGLDDAIHQWEQWNWNWLQFRASLPIDSYLEVNFSELLKDPPAAIKPLASFLGPQLFNAPAVTDYLTKLKAGVDDKARASSTRYAMMQMNPSPRFTRLVGEYGFDTFRTLRLSKPLDEMSLPLSGVSGAALLARPARAEPAKPFDSYRLVEPRLSGPCVDQQVPIFRLPKVQQLRRLRYFRMQCVCLLPSGALITPAGALIREPLAMNHDVTRRRLVPNGSTCSKAVMLPARVGYNRYFHWVSEVLPAFMMQEFTDTVAISNRAPQFIEETVELANALLGTSKLVERYKLPVWFENAIVPELAVKHGAGHSRLNADMVECFSRLRDALPDAGQPTRRLFISRTDSKHREVENEQLLADRFAATGYEVLVLSQLSMEEQWRAFREADEIVGFHGAGLANAMFLDEGRRLTEIMPSDFLSRVRVYWDVASVRRLDYRLHLIPPIGDRSTVAPENLAEVLKADLQRTAF